jgi:hypothetical protein
MIRKTRFSLMLAGSVAMTGCATYQGPSEQAGMVIGGVLGGVPAQWVNPDTGHQYTVVPTRTYDITAGP